MTGTKKLALATATSLAVLTAPALAQDATQPREVDVAQQCLTDLRAFATDASQQQFWLTGWGYPEGYGWNIAQPGAGPVDPVASAGDPSAPVTDPAMADPWTATGVSGSPRNELRILYSAAQVLAVQGNQEGCAYLLSEMRGMYDTYVSRLEDAGVDPAQVTSWRQERMALAEPITEVPESVTLTVDYLQGMDVRNPQDEHLGSVTDVVLERGSGDVEYVIVARGGLFGIGEDRIPVPWDQFRFAPGLNTLVLNLEQNAFENAPTVAETDEVTLRFEEVNSFWRS